MFGGKLSHDFLPIVWHTSSNMIQVALMDAWNRSSTEPQSPRRVNGQNQVNSDKRKMGKKKGEAFDLCAAEQQIGQSHDCSPNRGRTPAAATARRPGAQRWTLAFITKVKWGPLSSQASLSPHHYVQLEICHSRWPPKAGEIAQHIVTWH